MGWILRGAEQLQFVCIYVRSCLPGSVLNTVCYLSDFSTPCGRHIGDTEVLEYFRSVARPHGNRAAVAVYGERNEK